MANIDQWVILRTKSQLTLQLADALLLQGIVAWTPRHIYQVVAPRAKVRRRVIQPMTPSYVFSRADYYPTLQALADNPALQLVNFSVMLINDVPPVVSSDELDRLRVIEADLSRRQHQLELRELAKKKADYRFARDEPVKVRGVGGSFAGVIGATKRSDNAATLVILGNGMRLKLATSFLSSDNVGHGHPCLGTAAKAA